MLVRVGKFTQTCGQQVRGMATLKAISVRLKSVKNIQKITQSMKMVSAAKYSRAERELKVARPYGEGAKAFYEKAEIEAPVEAPKTLMIAMTSDRGLCGAVHSNIARKIKSTVEETTDDSTKFICVGDKSRNLLQGKYGSNFIMVCSNIGRTPPLFKDASKLAEAILDSGYEYSSGRIVYNRFRSVVSYNTVEIPIFSMGSITTAPKLSIYDSLDAQVIQCYLEYSLASLLYYCMKEGACSEQSARMTAMDGASKNAGEMIEKLTLTFNRTRQAVITRELIEIISGASAL